MPKNKDKALAPITEVPAAAPAVVETPASAAGAPKETFIEKVEDSVKAEVKEVKEIVKKDVALAKAAARVVKPVFHNVSLLEWPTDVWGFTTDLKKALIDTASKINGAEDKRKLVETVLATGIAHISAKFDIAAEHLATAVANTAAENEANTDPVPEAPASTEVQL